MGKKEKAIENFKNGYNCSQSVLLAFAEEIGLEKALLSRISCSFGGGMGRLREVCGACSGMFLAAGLLYGYEGPETGQVKADHYARIQELAAAYEKANGSIVCRELLGLSQKRDIPVPEQRIESYYKKRPCAQLAGSAAEILENYIRMHPYEAEKR